MADVVSIPLDKIAIGDRLRPADPDKALWIAASISERGLDTPIEVRTARKRGSYILIVGLHRLEAVRLLEWAEVPAIVSNLTEVEARLREIDENLYRGELSELDRAVFLSEKKRLHEELHPQTRHGGDRRSDQIAIFGDLVPRFTEEVRERLGCSERTIQRMIARAKIAPDVRRQIAVTKLANTGSELDALAKLSEDEQRQAVALMLAEEPERPTSVAAALKLMRDERPKTVTETDAQFEALLKAWRRAGAKARRRFIDHLVADGELATDGPGEEEA
jgi:ParB family chromosome partitioning protein